MAQLSNTRIFTDEVTLTLPYARCEHRVWVAIPGMTPTHRVTPTWTGDDLAVNGPGMDAITVQAVAAVDGWMAIITSASPIGGPLRILFQVV